MKKAEQVEVVEDPGDDTGILRCYLWWREIGEVTRSVLKPSESPEKDFGAVRRLTSGEWELVAAVQRGPTRRQIHFVAVSTDAIERRDRWRLVKLAPGVWDVPVSVHVPGQMHAFMTLLEVPEPAPWEA